MSGYLGLKNLKNALSAQVEPGIIQREQMRINMKRILVIIGVLIIIPIILVPIAFGEFQVAPINAGDITAGFFILDTVTGDIWLWTYVSNTLSYEGRAIYGLHAIKEKASGLVRYYPALPISERIKGKR